MSKKTFDYVIVGGGSAGCVLAARLSEQSDISVALIEYGGSDRSIWIAMPTALSYPMNMPRFDWGYNSEPEPGLDGRRLHCPRGKVIGGSSSINGMVYVRGHACDFEEWQKKGAQGWGYADVLPYFRRAETWVDGADDYRGNEGPLATCKGNDMRYNPLYQAFIDAGHEAGYPKTADYNGYQQEGFGAMHMTVKNGSRASTAQTYLKEARKRNNFTLITGLIADKLILDKGRTVGVKCWQNGNPVSIEASREVILATGSIGSPTLLQRSGIGAADALQNIGIKPIHDLPGVGANLQDHLEVYFQYKCLQPITLNNKLGLFSKAMIGARWLLRRDGLGATNHFEACGFIRSDAGVKWPDIQYHFLPAAMRYDGRAAFEGHGYQVHVGPNKPKSRGHVMIRDNNPLSEPSILFNYITHPDDQNDWRKAIRLTREILGQKALEPYRGDEIQPSYNITSDDEIDAWVRANVESAYHPSGTCRMGAEDDNMAVVNPKCQVRGIQNLRVIDSSIFPTIPNGNLNAPTIMVGEKGSDFVLGKQPLPPSNAPFWLDQGWEKNQRLQNKEP